MKFINIAFTLLFATATNAESISEQFDEQVQSSLRKSNRNVPGTSEDWLAALNEARELSTTTLGYDYEPLQWSADLMGEAQIWANSLAKKCSNGVPTGEENPGDYGVNTVLNMRNPASAVFRWMMNGEYD